jgi:hypothetical protein
MISIYSRTLSFLIILMTLHSPVYVQAENRPQAQEAQRALLRGQELLMKRKYLKAIEYFKKSHQLVRDVKNLMTIGAIYAKINQCPSAYTTWLEALNFCKKCTSSEQIYQKLRDGTSACTVVINVTSLPKSDISLNESPIGSTPLEFPVLIGTHSLSASAFGYIPMRRRIFIDRSQRGLVEDFTLTPIGEHREDFAGASRKNSPFTGEIKAPIAEDFSERSWVDGMLTHGSLTRKVTRNWLFVTSLVCIAAAVSFGILMTDDYNRVKGLVKSEHIKSQSPIDNAPFNTYYTLTAASSIFAGITLAGGGYLLISDW